MTATASGQSFTAKDPAFLKGYVPGVTIQKAVNAADPLHPTAAEDANDPNNPALLPAGTDVVWTYLVSNTTTAALTVNDIIDDNGTSTLTDDFHPVYVSGDTINNGQLDPGEVWLYTSRDVVSYKATTSLYGNIGTVTATGGGQTYTANDLAYLQGYVPVVHIQKAVNAVDPLYPTAAEDANDPAHPALLPVGTTVVWTYLVTNPGLAPLTVNSVKDDNGTPADPSDDFTAVAVLQTGTNFNFGDTNGNSLLDPTEVWLYSSQGVQPYQVTISPYVNIGTVTATAGGQTVTAIDPAYLQGFVPTVQIRKAVNAVDPLHPTAAEDANDPNNPAMIVAGNNVVWTYLVTNLLSTPLTVNSIVDDNGTPSNPGDDFYPGLRQRRCQ